MPKIVKLKQLHVGGITFFPFIFINSSVSEERFPVLLNHERIHIRQQVELLIIPFYLIYLVNYIFNLIRYRKHKPAYRNIIFEREAFAEENNFDYLKQRRRWNFLRY